MVALQQDITKDIARFHSDASSNTPVFIVGKNNAVCVNKTIASTGIAMDVSGKSQFSDKMSLLADLSLNGAAVINGTTDMKALVTASAGLTVSSGATSTQAITMNGAAEAKDGLTVSTGKLIVSVGDTEIRALKVALTSDFTGVSTFTAKPVFNDGIQLAAGTYIDQW